MGKSERAEGGGGLGREAVWSCVRITRENTSWGQAELGGLDGGWKKWGKGRPTFRVTTRAKKWQGSSGVLPTPYFSDRNASSLRGTHRGFSVSKATSASFSSGRAGRHRRVPQQEHTTHGSAQLGLRSRVTRLPLSAWHTRAGPPTESPAYPVAFLFWLFFLVCSVPWGLRSRQHISA